MADEPPAPADADDGAGKNAAAAVTLGSLPDEVLVVVFGLCDARTRLMAIPAVSRRWLGVCHHLMRQAAIDLTWSVRWETGCAITDAGLAGLALRFPGTAAIVLQDCSNVTDGGLGAVVAECPNLQHLTLGCCWMVTDGGLGAVAAGCPSLQHLNLAGCVSVTDAGLAAVAAGCPSLRHLSLAGCGKVTDAGLEAVAAGCPNLQHLNLGGCWKVTDAGAALCPNACVAR